MNAEMLLLLVLAAMTLLAYMIAINSHGPIRLAFSYLIATVILAGSVWATVQYVNDGVNSKKNEEFRKLELEKQKAEEKLSNREQAYDSALKENKERLAIAAKLTNFVSTGIEIATSIINVDLRDMSTDLDGLVSKSINVRRRAELLVNDFEKTKITDTLFTESVSIIKDGIKQLAEAGQYYTLYYKAEDSAQEELRDRIMRQKAKSALAALQRASILVTSKSSQ